MGYERKIILTRCAANQLCGDDIFRRGTRNNVGERLSGGGRDFLLCARKTDTCECVPRDRPQKGSLARSEERHSECRAWDASV